MSCNVHPSFRHALSTVHSTSWDLFFFPPSLACFPLFTMLSVHVYRSPSFQPMNNLTELCETWYESHAIADCSVIILHGSNTKLLGWGTVGPYNSTS